MTPQEATDLLFEAVQAGNLNHSKAALDAGADPNATDTWRRTPLHLAAKDGHTEIARLLIEKGADPTAKDKGQIGQMTPLHFAAGNGHTDLARVLIGNGADPTARDDRQRTPQHLATANGHTDLVELLQDAARGKPGHADRVAKSRGSDEPQIG